jgi:hypothetical protein
MGVGHGNGAGRRALEKSGLTSRDDRATQEIDYPMRAPSNCDKASKM